MAREHFWKDRATVYRTLSTKVRGEVQEATPVQVGAPIACLLRSISGKEAPAEARTYLPESALLEVMKRDTAGNPVVLLQGDNIEIQYAEDGGYLIKPHRFKIVGDIRHNRGGSELASFTVEVRQDLEF